MYRIIFLFVFFSLSILISISTSEAKWIISSGVDRTDISSDFNGYNILSTGTTAWLIPNVESDNGYNFSIGVAPDNEFAIFRVSYLKTNHTGWWEDPSYTDSSMEIEHTRITWLDLQLHLKESFIHPFILFNFSVHKFNIKNGLLEDLGSGLEVGDAELRGPSIGLGGGIRTKFYNRLSLSARATRVFGDIKKVKGGFYKEYIDAEDISFSGWNFRLYIDFHIL
ncbi:MAG: hypothetical protein DWP97_12050 [Calditrichaeota bacterium]|nr:MAG: hypothetical protein DWP97_12050 [Calditrichota bacterium]